eukprot:3477365-Alexandrium_andersonii.AAC.1
MALSCTGAAPASVRQRTGAAALSVKCLYRECATPPGAAFPPRIPQNPSGAPKRECQTGVPHSGS